MTRETCTVVRHKKIQIFPHFNLSAVTLLTLCIVSSGIFTGCIWAPKKNEKTGSKFPTPGQVVLRWNAAPNLTFNIYRRSENGSDIQINKEPVKPMEAFSGGKGLVSFQYVDRTVVVGEEYFYTLEEISKDGKTSIWETPWKMTATGINPPGQTK